MRPSAKRGRAQRKYQKYLDDLSIHTNRRNSPTVGEHLFDSKELGGLEQIKTDMTIPP